MVRLDEMRHVAEELAIAYAERLKAFSQIIGESHELLNRKRTERHEIEAGLRELLASNASLRHRDFDLIMGEIIEEQEKREEAVKESLQKFLAEQQVLADRLKGALTTGDLGLVKFVQMSIEKGMSEMKQLLKDFHLEEQMLIRRLKMLLEKGPSLTVPVFRKAVSEIQEHLRMWAEPAA